jgi:predicted transcriptional regulator of viral defense system
MVVKTDLSHLDRIRKILKGQGGVLFSSNLGQFQIPRVYLSMLEQSAEIERISRGVYKTSDAMEDEMFIFQSRYKFSIFSHETALYLHDLTDRSPLAYSISVPSGYHSSTLNKSGHKIYYVNRNLFNLGIVLIKSPHGNEIRVSNLERTICDILRSRNQIDVQFVGEALRRYVRKKEKNIDLLHDYAKSFRIQKIVREYIEVLL